MNSEPRLEKNYVVALVLCMLVLLAYPFVLQKFFPRQQPAVEQAAETPESPAAREVTTATVSGPKAAEILPSAAAPAPEKEPETVHYENDLYEAEFSTLGGTLTKLVYKGDPEKRSVTRTVLYEDPAGTEGIFAARFVNDDEDLSEAVFTAVRQGREENVFKFTYEKQGEYLIEKEYVLSAELPVISLDVRVQNLSSRERNFAVELFAGMTADVRDQALAHEFQAIARTDKVVSADHGKVSKKGFGISQEAAWAGIIKKYFAVLIKPDAKIISYEARVTSPGTMLSRLRVEPFGVQAGQAVNRQFFIYAGPQKYETLKRFEVGFDQILSRGILGELKILLLRALKLSHQYTRNFGWDIIILTIIIKLLLSPLTHMSYKSMEKMKAIQPKVKALQEKHKEDPARMNREMMELYKKHKVNPMGGCLPMLLQIPIFIAFYQVLNETIELRGTPFIGWVTDLSEPDTLFRLPFSIPFAGDGFHFLPLLMIASMVVQQRLTPQTGVTPEQQKIFNLMPLIFGFIFYKMPSGLVLYWFVNNVLSIIQQLFVSRIDAKLHHDHE